jgi:hypothetical protein
LPGFSLGTPTSSTTKTGRHDIAEILLKVALKHHKSNQYQLVYHRTLLTYQKIWQINLLYTYPVGNLSPSALNLLTGAWFCSFNWSLSVLSLPSIHSFRDFNSKRSNFLSISSLNILHFWYQASSWKIGIICEIFSHIWNNYIGRFHLIGNLASHIKLTIEHLSNL